MSVSTVEIGSRLKDIRQIFKLSQKEFAQHIDIHQSLLSDMENGKRNISYSTLISLINFNSTININYLIKGSPPILLDDIYHNDIKNEQSTAHNLKYDDEIWIEPKELEYLIKKINKNKEKFLFNKTENTITSPPENENIIQSQIKLKTFETTENTMAPHILKGDVLLCAKLGNVEDVRSGYLYLVATKLKQFSPHYIYISNEFFILIPHNRKKCNPISILKKDVINIYLVTTLITHRLPHPEMDYI